MRSTQVKPLKVITMTKKNNALTGISGILNVTKEKISEL